MSDPKLTAKEGRRTTNANVSIKKEEDLHEFLID